MLIIIPGYAYSMFDYIGRNGMFAKTSGSTNKERKALSWLLKRGLIIPNIITDKYLAFEAKSCVDYCRNWN